MSCIDCGFYSGDSQMGVCHALPPVLNMAIIKADWTEDQLGDASVRPLVMAVDISCIYFKAKD